MLKLVDVEKEYEGFKLKKINFELKKSEFLSLLGPSGCGKTTLLKIAAGLIEDHRGSIFLNEKKISGIKLEYRGISMVFQDALLFPNMNVEENVSFGLKMKGIAKKERLQKARELLEDLGLKAYGKRSPADLSGGEQQRVSIARALIVEPEILLMDEPFNSLDYNLRIEMQKLIKNIHKKREVTILFVTHDRDEAFYLSDRIALMNKGEILQIDSPLNIYEKPLTEFIAKFLGAENIYSGAVKNRIFKNSYLELKTNFDFENEDVKIILRPETLKTSSEVTEFGFYAELEESVFKNGFYHLKFRLGDKKLYIIQEEDVKEKKVFINYRPEKLQVIKTGG